MLKRSFEIAKDLWKRAQIKAIQEDMSVSEAIRRLLEKWINGEIKL